MTIKTFFAIFAVLSVLFGIGFVLTPGQVLSNYGVENSPAVALVRRDVARDGRHILVREGLPR